MNTGCMGYIPLSFPPLLLRSCLVLLSCRHQGDLLLFLRTAEQFRMSLCIVSFFCVRNWCVAFLLMFGAAMLGC